MLAVSDSPIRLDPERWRGYADIPWTSAATAIWI